MVVWQLQKGTFIMNNENIKLQINPEFENMIPELTDDEFLQLEENVLAEGGIVNPIVVWNGVIVDGHNRYKIAQKHPHIEFSIHEKEFENEQEAQIWICSNQLGRRNLTEQHKKYLWGKRYNLECDRAKFHGKSNCASQNHLTLPREKYKFYQQVPVSRFTLRMCPHSIQEISRQT